MDPQRQGWARQQQEVRRLLASGPHDEAMALWLRQHAALHAAPLAGLPADQVRRRSGPGSRSIAWLLWHATRIEDVTMNLLVAGTAQVLDSASWLSRLGLAGHDVGTAMDDDEVAAVSDRLDLDALLAYRLAVGRRTQEIACALGPDDLRMPVAPERIQALLASAALSPGALGLAETWSRWTTVRFLMMPATRHAFTHLNEARVLADRWRRSPSSAAVQPPKRP